jgi:hypothetical protein
LDWLEGIDIILELLKSIEDKKMWELYLTTEQTQLLLNPHRDEKQLYTPLSFHDFKQKLHSEPQKNFSEEDKAVMRNKAQEFNKKLEVSD